MRQSDPGSASTRQAIECWQEKHLQKVPQTVGRKMSLEIVIRDATADDAQGIVNLWNPIIESGLYTTFVTPLTAEEERAYIERMTDRHIFHVAERVDTKQIVGMQTCAPFPSYTTVFNHVSMISTYVDLNLHRQGIAKRLFPVTIEVARQKGFEKFFTYVRADNPKGLTTYLSQGFRIVGTAQNHAKINGRYVDEIIIEKFL